MTFRKVLLFRIVELGSEAVRDSSLAIRTSRACWRATSLRIESNRKNRPNSLKLRIVSVLHAILLIFVCSSHSKLKYLRNKQWPTFFLAPKVTIRVVSNASGCIRQWILFSEKVFLHFPNYFRITSFTNHSLTFLNPAHEEAPLSLAFGIGNTFLFAFTSN